MRERLFVDTVFAIALVNHRDQYHGQAVELYHQFEGCPLITTDSVLLEIGNALSRGFKAQGVEIIEAFLHTEDVNVVDMRPSLFSRAMELYKTYDDKEWGLVDCLSFVVMRDEEVTTVLTCDHYFAQAGFAVLMREVS